MGGVKMVAMALVMIAVSLEGKWVGAQVHHVVGGDRGWDPSSNVASWADGRIFSVGDKIWFTYSAAHETVAELKSREEYESCDASNPIKMYTDGLDSIPLDGEGIRYFASSNPESCRNGLKLHVDVQPKQKAENPTVPSSGSYVADVAAGPTNPSDSPHISGLSSLFLGGLLLCLFCI